ncbi:hypothetical protein PLCT1_01709 [Planctomycetaceae bacterium]|nr:hypothetical protein PLCT1_01709 [Planctomycetaceae bacterium]
MMTPFDRRDWEMPHSRVKLLQPHVAFGAIMAPIVLGVLVSCMNKKGDSTALGVGAVVTVAVILLLIVAAFIDGAIRHFRENRNLRTLLSSNAASEKIGPPRGDWMYAGLALVFCGGVFVMFLTLIASFSDDHEIIFWFGVPVATVATVVLAFGFGRIERYVVVSRAYSAARAREDALRGLPRPPRPPLKAVFIGLAIWIVPALGIAQAAAEFNPPGAFYVGAVFLGAFLFFVGLGAIGVYLNAREHWVRWQQSRAASKGVSAPDAVVLMRGLLLLAISAIALGMTVAAIGDGDEAAAMLFSACGVGFAMFAKSFLARYAKARHEYLAAVDEATNR